MITTTKFLGLITRSLYPAKGYSSSPANNPAHEGECFTIGGDPDGECFSVSSGEPECFWIKGYGDDAAGGDDDPGGGDDDPGGGGAPIFPHIIVPGIGEGEDEDGQSLWGETIVAVNVIQSTIYILTKTDGACYFSRFEILRDPTEMYIKKIYDPEDKRVKMPLVLSSTYLISRSTSTKEDPSSNFLFSYSGGSAIVSKDSLGDINYIGSDRPSGWVGKDRVNILYSEVASSTCGGGTDDKLGVYRSTDTLSSIYPNEETPLYLYLKIQSGARWISDPLVSRLKAEDEEEVFVYGGGTGSNIIKGNLSTFCFGNMWSTKANMQTDPTIKRAYTGVHMPPLIDSKYLYTTPYRFNGLSEFVIFDYDLNVVDGYHPSKVGFAVWDGVIFEPSDKTVLQTAVVEAPTEP